LLSNPGNQIPRERPPSVEALDVLTGKFSFG